MKLQENRPNVSEAVLLDACFLTNQITAFRKDQFPQSEWPKNRLDCDRLKASWRLYHASHWHFDSDSQPIGVDQDYQGVILINHEEKQVILAHRGLQLESIANLVSGLVIGTKRCPDIAKAAIAFCDIARNCAQQHQYQLIHTGFSMGGYLSQITGAYANHHSPGSGTVICFEAAGAAPAIEFCGYNDNRNNTVNYVTAPNVVNTCNRHYGFLRQIDEFKGHNFYLKSHLKPQLVNNKVTLNLDDIDETTAALFEEILWLTIHYHRPDVLGRALTQADALQFVPIHAWPVSTISLETVAAKELPTAVAENTSYGMILNNIIKNSRVIRNLAGYEGCNTLTYNLPCPDIIYTPQTHPEVFCEASSTMQATSHNPYAAIVDNDNKPEEPYDPCVLM